MKTFSLEELESIKSGDTSPLQKVFLAHYDYCTESLVSFDGCSMADAKDVVMDAIQVLRDKIMQGKFINQNLKSYLLTVSRNKLRNKLKRDRKSLPFEPAKVEAYLKDKEGHSVLTELQQKKVDVALLALKQMGGKCENLLRRNLYDGFALKEIQEELGYKSLDVIKNTKSRCMKKLRELVLGLMQKQEANG